MISGNELLQRFLKSSIEKPADEAHVNELIPVFMGVLHFYKCLQGHPTPYHDITEFIYNYKDEIRIDDLEILMGAIELKLVDISEDCVKCFRKFRRHISLAVTQKQYIQKVANDAFIAAEKAEKVASHAEKIANKAQGIANSAEKISNKAKQDSQKADQLAEKAEKLANEADAQAKSTIANYISILGIFASIIFTLFGGVNLIGSTVKLLEVNSRWPYLTFIIALLMICLLTLLNMMVKWINSMSNLRKALENHNDEGGTIIESQWYKPWSWDFYTKAVSFFLLILLISMCGMYNVNKENLFSITTETTTKSVPKGESNMSKPAVKLESEGENKEITVVEKITLSNHTNEKSSDKEE